MLSLDNCLYVFTLDISSVGKQILLLGNDFPIFGKKPLSKPSFKNNPKVRSKALQNLVFRSSQNILKILNS